MGVRFMLALRCKQGEGVQNFLLHWTLGSVLEYVSQHEACQGHGARIYTAVDTCSQVGCGLVTMDLKYSMYIVVSITFVLPQSPLGGQTEHHCLWCSSYSNIQPILIPQEFGGQIGSYPRYFKAGRKIQPPMTCSSSILSGIDLLIPAFHPRDKFLNSTRGPSKKHPLKQLPG